MSQRPPFYDPQRSATLNALIGGVLGILLFFIPASTVVGGGIAGYLEGPDTSEGLRVGALAGLVALVPFLLLALLFGGIILAFVPTMGPRGGAVGALGIVGILLFVAFTALYTVGLSALGGILGAYVHREL